MNKLIYLFIILYILEKTINHISEKINNYIMFFMPKYMTNLKFLKNKLFFFYEMEHHTHYNCVILSKNLEISNLME